MGSITVVPQEQANNALFTPPSGTAEDLGPPIELRSPYITNANTNAAGGLNTQNTKPNNVPLFQFSTTFPDGGTVNRPGSSVDPGGSQQINILSAPLQLGNDPNVNLQFRNEFRFPNAINNPGTLNVTDNPDNPTEIGDIPRIRSGAQFNVDGASFGVLWQRNIGSLLGGSQNLRLEANTPTFQLSPDTTLKISTASMIPLRPSDNGNNAPAQAEFFGTLTHQAAPDLKLSATVLDVYTFNQIGTLEPNNLLRVTGSAELTLQRDDKGNPTEVLEGNLVFGHTTADLQLGTERLNNQTSVRGEVSYLNVTDPTGLKVFAYDGVGFASDADRLYGGAQLETDRLFGLPVEARLRVDALFTNAPVIDSTNLTVDSSVGWEFAKDWTFGGYATFESNSVDSPAGNTNTSPNSQGLFLGYNIAPRTELQLRVPLNHSNDGANATNGAPRIEVKFDL